MQKNNIESNEAKKLIEGLSNAIDPHLVEGRTYHSDIVKTEYGSSGGSIYFYEDGILHNFAYSGKYDKDELRKHTRGLKK